MPREPLCTRLNTLWVFQRSELCHQAVEVSIKVQCDDLVHGGETKKHEPGDQEQYIFKIVHDRPWANILEVTGFVRFRVRVEYVRGSMSICAVQFIGRIIKAR